jgi:hypothetical protein
MGRSHLCFFLNSLFALGALNSYSDVMAIMVTHGGGSEGRQPEKTAEDAGPSRRAESIQQAYDGFPYGISFGEAPPKDGTVEMQFSPNRCEPGILRFGNTQCRVMGRGFGAKACTDTASYDQPNGHTPVGTFRLKDHPVGNKNSWGEEPAIALVGTPERAGIVFHDVKRAEEFKPEMPGNTFTELK